MAEYSLSGITGSDGEVPIYEPDGRWTMWSLEQIYNGGVGAARYVPKIKDYVIDTDTDEKYIVSGLDPTTMVAVLTKIIPANVTGLFDDSDILLGVGPGTASDTYRVYLDTTVIPYTLSVDARLFVYGTMVKTCKIYRGSAVVGNQEVISAMYDQTGNLLGQAIPLELALEQGPLNRAVWSVPTCHTTALMPDNEIVTAVFFSDSGHVVSKRQLLVENSSFIRASTEGTKYVTNIYLESPFLSQADPLLIQYPINVPLNGLNLMGVVQYSDGTQKRMPVDQTKFSVFGLENFVATIVGQKAPLVLKYALSPDEVGYGLSVGSDRFIAKNYRLQTTRADGIYSVKLFGYPVWIDALNGYRMEWYLYNLERQLVFYATPYVRFNDNAPAFDPVAYGVSQRLSVSVNLKDLNPSYNHYNHVQTLNVVLLGEGSLRDTNWTIGFDPGQNPPYGRDNFAALEFVNQNLRRVNLGMGAATKEEWLTRIYYNTKPLVDTARESLPPEPNFFAVMVGTTPFEFPISQWNSTLEIGGQLLNNDTLLVRFFFRTSENDLQLSLAGLPLYQQ